MASRIPIVLASGRLQQLQSADVLYDGTDEYLTRADLALRTFEARLTPTSGSPEATSAAFSTLYLSPYRGNKINLYDGSVWRTHTLSEISVAIPSIQYRLFDVFVYDNNGTLTLETQNWTQTSASITGATNASPIVVTSTGHGLSNGDFVGVAGVGGNTAANGLWEVANVATDTFELLGSTGDGAYTSGGTWFKINGQSNSGLTTQNGITVKSGSTGKRYCGIGMTSGTSGVCRVDATHVWLANVENQIQHRLSLFYGTSHTYASTTFRHLNGDGTQFRSFLVPNGRQSPTVAFITPQMNGDGASAPTAVITLGSFNGATQDCHCSTAATTSQRFSAVGMSDQSEGFHYRAPAESRFNTGTATFTQLIFRMYIPR